MWLEAKLLLFRAITRGTIPLHIYPMYVTYPHNMHIFVILFPWSMSYACSVDRDVNMIEFSEASGCRRMCLVSWAKPNAVRQNNRITPGADDGKRRRGGFEVQEDAEDSTWGKKTVRQRRGGWDLETGRRNVDGYFGCPKPWLRESRLGNWRAHLISAMVCVVARSNGLCSYVWKWICICKPSDHILSKCVAKTRESRCGTIIINIRPIASCHIDKEIVLLCFGVINLSILFNALLALSNLYLRPFNANSELTHCCYFIHLRTPYLKLLFDVRFSNHCE